MNELDTTHSTCHNDQNRGAVNIYLILRRLVLHDKLK